MEDGCRSGHFPWWPELSLAQRNGTPTVLGTEIEGFRHGTASKSRSSCTTWYKATWPACSTGRHHLVWSCETGWWCWILYRPVRVSGSGLAHGLCPVMVFEELTSGSTKRLLVLDKAWAVS